MYYFILIRNFSNVLFETFKFLWCTLPVMDQESGQKAFFFKWLFSMILFKYWFYLKKLSLYSNWVWPDGGAHIEYDLMTALILSMTCWLSYWVWPDCGPHIEYDLITALILSMTWWWPSYWVWPVGSHIEYDLIAALILSMTWLRLSYWVWPDGGLILVVIKLYSVNLQKYDNAFLVQE